MIKVLNTLSLLLVLFFLESCTASRSAGGLDGGSVNISYIAPFAASVRFGVLDNIEVRAMLIGKVISSDFFFHTHNDSSKFNFGLALGTRLQHGLSNGDFPQTYYSTITISKRYKKTTPYFTYTLDSDRDISSYFAFGNEIDIYNNKKSKSKLKLILIPELNYYIKPYKYFMESRSNVGGSLGLGISFDFVSLF